MKKIISKFSFKRSYPNTVLAPQKIRLDYLDLSGGGTALLRSKKLCCQGSKVQRQFAKKVETQVIGYEHSLAAFGVSQLFMGFETLLGFIPKLI